MVYLALAQNPEECPWQCVSAPFLSSVQNVCINNSEGKYPSITTMTSVGEILLHILYQQYILSVFSFIKNLDKNSLVVQSLSQQEHKHKQHNTKTKNTKTVMLRTS